ncbi:MAG: DUF1460 domain-containing protein [Ignavibacteriaceae bacterium]|nr:DUF1460 domain-containing protein [Ignavibacteriaceae bacterium]
MKLFLLFSFLYLFQSSLIYCQVYSEKDVEICNSKFNLSENTHLKSKPIGDVIASIGKSFIGTDYKASTLEKEGAENLVINLTGLDCTTFLEYALVFSRLIKTDSITFNNFLSDLKFIRYRNGIINSYTSRLHYFSDWIYDNVKKKVVKDITKDLGGIPIKFQLSYMSGHPGQYKQLKENPVFIPTIKSQEDSINTRTYFYIPKNKVYSVEAKLKEGDLIAFTTSVKGLDIGHVGIAVKEKDGRIHLLHAPQPDTKVQITKYPLADYILSLNKDTGIIVLRALEH